MSSTLIYQYLNESTTTVTIPSGYSSNVMVYAWGGGGGDGTGATGGGGGFVYGNIIANAGDTITVSVGSGGTAASGATGGQGGKSTNPIFNFNGGDGANGSDPEDGDAGGSGGGGAASSVLVNNIPVIVAAGGAGGGGYGEDGASGATAGLPGGIYRGYDSATDVYPVSLSYAWCSFLNTYGVWGGGQDYSVSINFPVTGTYTFNYSVDNYGSISLDGTPIITRTGEFNYGSYYTATHTVSAGTHTVRVIGANLTGPAGVAAQILNPDSSELWNTRALTLVHSDGRNIGTNGQNGNAGGSGGSGGGGGGYPFGGATGPVYGDDGSGGSGGSGGMNYAVVAIGQSATIENGVGATPGGLSSAYYPGSKKGYVGYGGAVILVFTKTFTSWIKESGDWKLINRGWIKTPSNIITTKVEETSTPTTVSFKIPGTTSWTVPANVKSVDVTYPTVSGLVKTTVTVNPGDSIPMVIGDYGKPSSFGGISIPGYEQQVFSYSGNVDNDKDNVVQVVTASGVSYTGSGNNDTQKAGAAAVGILYDDGTPSEGWHGDLTSTISITPVKLSTVLSGIQVYNVSGSGREYTNHHSITQQPSAANNYTMHDYQYDGGSGEGTYSWTTNIQQQGYIRLDYAPVIPGKYVTISTGGWKEIIKGWIKQNGTWKLIESANPLVPSSIKNSAIGYTTINIVISANTNNYNLLDYLSGYGYVAGHSLINLIVNSGVTVGSDTVGTPALSITGLAANDIVNVINNGTIVGKGGDGGAAGSYTVQSGYYTTSKFGGTSFYSGPAPKGSATVTIGSSIPGRPGQNGGTGLYTTHKITLANNGVVAGGGGGGGGGGGPTGGQGGGGAGHNVGLGGNYGTATAGGAGAGLGGHGGALGADGTAGSNSTNAGGTGGLGGPAIEGYNNVAVTVQGSILGALNL